MSDPEPDVQVLVTNQAQDALRLILLQKPAARLSSCSTVYACAARFLNGQGAFWKFSIPCAFEVAAQIDLGDGDASSSNIAPAAYGQQWSIQQEKEGELQVVRGKDLASLAAVRITNDVDFARRQAILLKGSQPLFGADLDAGGGSIDLALDPSFTLAVVEEPVRPGDVVDLASLTRFLDIPTVDADDVMQFQVTLQQDSLTGKITFGLELVPWRHAAPGDTTLSTPRLEENA